MDVIKEAEEPKRRSGAVHFLIRLAKEKPLGTVGGVVVLLLLITGIFAGQLAPYGMNETHGADALMPPSSSYILGTDHVGRDMLSRVIFGARVSLIVGLAASSVSVIISTVIGILCGYFGGWLDTIVQRFVDAWMCFPGLVLLIVISSFLGAGMWQVIVSLGLLFGISGSRTLRGATISVRENVYMEAAEAIGCPTTRILTRHILPNIMAPLIVLYSTRVPAAILTEASLSFLGFGIPPPEPSWGGMLSGAGRGYMFLAPWMAIWPGLALSTVVYGVNMFGDAVRDMLDPRLRGGVGRYERRKTKKVRQAV